MGSRWPWLSSVISWRRASIRASSSGVGCGGGVETTGSSACRLGGQTGDRLAAGRFRQQELAGLLLLVLEALVGILAGVPDHVMGPADKAGQAEDAEVQVLPA